MTARDTRPPDPSDDRLLLQALVDGELDAGTILALERRMAADPALAAEHARLVALTAAVRRLPRPQPAAEFAARMAALASGETRDAPAGKAVPAAAVPSTDPESVIRRLGGRRPAAIPTGGRAQPPSWRTLAASVLMGMALASGATLWITGGGVQDSMADAVARSHRRGLLAASPTDVASSDRHTVKPWLDARIGLSPPAPDLAPDGFALLGGRVEVIGTAALPALVYRHREHLITVIAAPQARAVGAADTETLAAQGFEMAHWAAGGFSYWAVSDVSPADLDRFVRLFRAAAAE